MIKIPEISDLPPKLNVAQVKAIILETIINPIYTDNGSRADRATSLPKYKIEANSIVGQFIATQDDQDVLFDFVATKTGGKWDLQYYFSEDKLPDSSIESIKRSLQRFEPMTVTKDYIAKPQGFYSQIDTDSAPVAFGVPTKEQLAKINKYRPLGSPQYKAEDVVTVTFMASNNLLNLNMLAWDLESLMTMKTAFLGKPLTQDHEWEDSDDVCGTIYDSRLMRSDMPPADVINAGGMQAANIKKIVDDGGYYWLELDVFMIRGGEETDEIIKNIQSWRLHFCSTGGFRSFNPMDGGMICGDCQAPYGHNGCDHAPPSKIMSPDMQAIASTYTTRTGFSIAVELSLVLCPNLPMAGVLQA